MCVLVCVCVLVHVCVRSVNDIKETQNVFVENMKTGRAKHANPLNPPQSAAGVAPQPPARSLRPSQFIYKRICILICICDVCAGIGCACASAVL